MDEVEGCTSRLDSTHEESDGVGLAIEVLDRIALELQRYRVSARIGLFFGSGLLERSIWQHSTVIRRRD